MDSRQSVGGVKVTYIETQFVTSDAAGFKDLVQRLTGKSPTAVAPAAAPHRPRACRAAGEKSRTAAAAAGAGPPQGCRYYQPPGGARSGGVAAASCAPPCQLEELLLGMDDDDFSGLFYAGAIDQRRHGLNGGYGGFHY